jgi:pseudaminic acid biosynthesis-associated methylase
MFMRDGSEAQDIADTKQSEAWRGEFGTEYGERNLLDPPALDTSYQRKYGVTRSALNQQFLADIPKTASILEVGCNLGNQLVLLRQMGFENLTGIEIHKEIVKHAQTRVLEANVMEGSGLAIPFDDAGFDLVFTAGLLIHIAPHDLPVVMREIHRCSKRWIWGLEYYAPQMTEVPYRGHSALLWKTDYADLYTKSFGDLDLALEKRLKYLETDNIDTMFLLNKRAQ